MKKTPSEHTLFSNELISSISNTLPVLIAYIDSTERYRFNNKGYVDWFGQPQDTLYGKTLRYLLGPRAYAIVKPHIKSALSGRQVTYETLMPYKVGKSRFVRTTYVPHIGPKKKVLGFFAIVEDMSETRQVQNSLEFLSNASKILSLSLDYKKTLTKTAELAISYIADWCLIEIEMPNGSLDPVVLLHKKPFKTRYASRLRRKNPPARFSFHLVSHILRTGQAEVVPTVTENIMLKTAQDQSHLAFLRYCKLVSVICVPIFSEGKTIGVISFATSESNKHYSKNDLFIAEELASRASIAIENARLFEREQKAVRARDEFLSIASHELKTPLTSIQAFVQILKRRFSGDLNVKPMLERTDVQIKRLTNLVSNLLDITKIQAGKFTFNEDTCNMDSIVAGVITDFQLTHNTHNVIIKGSSKKEIECDSERLNQVLTNLLSNAVKYSPNSNKIVVTIRNNTKNVVVSVKDFGIGISKPVQEKVFERYFRESPAKRGTFSSLGLGLYIAAEIVKRHNGKIWLKSRKGQGSEFFFSVPFRVTRQ